MTGSLLSPAHGATVRERYRTNPSEIIPSPHRLAVAQLLVQNSKLLSVDPWEITRRRAMDYLSLLEHTQAIVGEQFPGVANAVCEYCGHFFADVVWDACMLSRGKFLALAP